MGKYMRKSKPAADVAVMEVSGVRTRAKTLALQRSSSSYLQLRSRRLEKPPLLRAHHAPPKPPKPTREEEKEKRDELGEDEEACFGENVISEFDQTRDRITRESTPCSLIRDPDAIRTPGSTTRPTNSAGTNRRMQNSSQRHIPTSHDMDEFFAGAEVEQQQHFIDKYNFDPVNEKPLPGHYEWEKLDS